MDDQDVMRDRYRTRREANAVRDAGVAAVVVGAGTCAMPWVLPPCAPEWAGWALCAAGVALMLVGAVELAVGPAHARRRVRRARAARYRNGTAIGPVWHGVTERRDG